MSARGKKFESVKYGRVIPAFWKGETGRTLRRFPDAQRVALYLISCSASVESPIGLFPLAIPAMAHEIGITADAAGAALAKLEEIGFAYHDAETDDTWVPTLAAVQIGESMSPNDNRVVWVRDLFSRQEKSPFAAAFLSAYGRAFHLQQEAPSQGSTKAPSRGAIQDPPPSPPKSSTSTSASTTASGNAQKRVEKKTSGAARARAARPAGWHTVPEGETLTPERLALATEHGFDELSARREWAKFTANEFAKLHHDVGRSWSKWVLNAVEYAQRDGRPLHTTPGQRRPRSRQERENARDDALDPLRTPSGELRAVCPECDTQQIMPRADEIAATLGRSVACGKCDHRAPRRAFLEFGRDSLKRKPDPVVEPEHETDFEFEA